MKHTSEEIKYRLSDLGVQIGKIAIEYIAELEEKISILLSCKNCPDNKGGYICQKEYEEECLAQKIQYIKELKEEIAELKKKIENLQKYLDTRNCYRECAETWVKLTKTKDLLKKLYDETRGYINDRGFDVKILAETEQFIKECE